MRCRSLNILKSILSIKSTLGHHVSSVRHLSTSINLYGENTKQFNFIADAAEKASPAVVYIEVIGQQYGYHSNQPIGSGSGFMVTDYGIILTNAHVVNQATQLNIKLKSNEILNGEVIDADPIADLAVVKITGQSRKFSTIQLGNSAKIRPGEWVVALGSPLNLSGTVTAGIVSSVHRGGKDLGLKKGDMKYIQTDAAINRGNSGGPLINLDGEVIGINTMTLLNTNGISFAVPIDRAKSFLLQALEKQDLVKSGRKSSTTASHRPYIGLKMMTLTPDIEYQLTQQFRNFPQDLSHGVLVVDVIHDSPSYRACLQPYDVIVEADNVMLSSSDSLTDFVARGREFDVTVIRGLSGNKITLRIKPKIVASSNS